MMIEKDKMRKEVLEKGQEKSMRENRWGCDVIGGFKVGRGGTFPIGDRISI
jgi:hypothetical protein